jgi:hypothetical protein
MHFSVLPLSRWPHRAAEQGGFTATTRSIPVSKVRAAGRGVPVLGGRGPWSGARRA